MTALFLEAPRRLVDVTIDGATVRVPEGTTLVEACRQQGIDTPTLCYLENLSPVNVCRVCVVEVEGSRTLVPACSRKAEPGVRHLPGRGRAAVPRPPDRRRDTGRDR
jgi:NADP-reducing hydrogenase subunit HndD